MSADIDKRLLWLVQLTRLCPPQVSGLAAGQAQAEADALLGELSREWREMAERIRELETALRPLANRADNINPEKPDAWLVPVSIDMLRAARRALGGAP